MRTCSFCGEQINNKLKTSNYFFTNIRNNLIICGACVKLAINQICDREIQKLKEFQNDCDC
jgi:hypothetical protein